MGVQNFFGVIQKQNKTLCILKYNKYFHCGHDASKLSYDGQLR